MLILNKSLGESIVIGDDIEILLLLVTPGSVKVGVEAPKNVAVHRQEIFEKIRLHNINKEDDA